MVSSPIFDNSHTQQTAPFFSARYTALQNGQLTVFTSFPRLTSSSLSIATSHYGTATVLRPSFVLFASTFFAFASKLAFFGDAMSL